jgi:hypothetical protein
MLSLPLVEISTIAQRHAAVTATHENARQLRRLGLDPAHAGAARRALGATIWAATD